MKKIIKYLLAVAMCMPLAANAAVIKGHYPVLYIDVDWELIEVLIVMVILMAIIVIMQAFEIRMEVKQMRKKVSEVSGKPFERRVTWFDLFRRGHVHTDVVVEGHVYDNDIREYDNSPPAWFNWLFYCTIATAVIYLCYYHVFKIGDLQAAEYAKEMKQYAPLEAAAKEKAIKLADEPMISDAAKMKDGKQIFLKNCIICHGEQGQGIVGPNLTDEYWLHGGAYKDVFKTIFNGVESKGMKAWKKEMNPEDIRLVASYVYTLRDTKPTLPVKAPEGVNAAGLAPGK
jgi:cytochrome c oxidase cbb3-type subunit 3